MKLRTSHVIFTNYYHYYPMQQASEVNLMTIALLLEFILRKLVLMNFKYSIVGEARISVLIFS